MTLRMVCRCCLDEDAPCRDLFSIYEWMGEKEVYTEMLMESFDIALQVSECVDAGICEGCVLRLRDSTDFKRQVLRLEGQFRQRMVTVKDEIEDGLRKESDGDDAYDNSDRDHAIDDDGKEDIKDILPLSTFVKKSKRSIKSASKSVRGADVKKIKIKDEPGPSRTRDKNSVIVKKGAKVTIGSTTIKPAKASAALIETAKPEDRTERISKNFMRHLKTIPEKLKHKVNTSAIVKFSNVTPFKDKIHDGYVCFYCIKTFVDPAILREHTKTEHAEEKLNYFTKLKSQDSHVKVDITDLACTICAMNIADLTALKEHLVTEHKKKLFTDLSDKMLPFRLNEPPLHCTICSQAFETFKMLHQHMNSHYRNFVCQQCGTGFVTLKRLKFHEMRHSDGDFKCNVCDKTFKSAYKMNYHVKGVHLGMWQRNKCPHCPEKFTDYYKKQKHLVEVHNEAKIEYRCNACNKEFSTKNRLTNHTKSYHLQEVNFQCDICLQTFYARRDLHRHMAKHSDERFECNICQKTFASKTTLREHSRGHTDDRRFGCSKCSKVFKHKMTLQNHENTHHTESFGLVALGHDNIGSAVG